MLHFVAGAIILHAIVLFLGVRAVLALAGTLAEHAGNASAALNSAVNHLDSLADATTPAEFKRDLANLDARFNDLEERTERRYRTISARARRAETPSGDDTDADWSSVAATLPGFGADASPSNGGAAGRKLRPPRR